MGKIDEGLETGEFDVSTESGFAAAIAAKTGGVLPEGDAPISTDIASGLEEVEEPQRDDKGRFVPATPVKPEESPDEGGDKPLHSDPDIAEYLKQFDGDLDKALSVAANAQKVIGRQGQELGDLRERQAKIEGRLEQIDRAPAQQAVPLSQAKDYIEELVTEHGGITALQMLASDPVLASDRRYAEMLFKEWASQDDTPYDALAVRQDYFKFLDAEEDKAKGVGKPQPDEWVETQKFQSSIDRALDVVQKESTDWDEIKDNLTPALEKVPQRVLTMLESNDPSEQEDAARMIANQARVMSHQALAAKAKEGESKKAIESKKLASLGGSSLRPASGQGETKKIEDMTSEERVALFKSRLLQTESTSVHDGLTFAKG